MKNKFLPVLILIIGINAYGQSIQSDAKDESILFNNISFNDGKIRYGMSFFELKKLFPKGILKKIKIKDSELDDDFFIENRFYFSNKNYAVISVSKLMRKEIVFEVVLEEGNGWLDPYHICVGNDITKLKKKFPLSYEKNKVEKKIIQNKNKIEPFFLDIKHVEEGFYGREYFIIWYSLENKKIIKIERESLE